MTRSLCPQSYMYSILPRFQLNGCVYNYAHRLEHWSGPRVDEIA